MTYVTFEVPTKSAQSVETSYETGGIDELVYRFPVDKWKLVSVDDYREED